MHRSFHLVLILVADGSYLAVEEARRLLWLSKSSYYDRELLRVIEFRHRCSYNDNKSLLTHNILVQNELRVDLLLSVGCKPFGAHFSHAVQLGRFDMVDKMVATLASPSDIRIDCGLLKSFGDELNTEHFRRLIASPHVEPFVKLLISMVHESMIDGVKEALDAVTEAFTDFNWPTLEVIIDGKTRWVPDDPLQLEAEGWVWVSPDDENVCQFLSQEIEGRNVEFFDMTALKLVYSHPLISNDDMLELAADNSDPINARLTEFREWTCEVVDDTMYGDSSKFPRYLVYAASCFNLLSRVDYLLTHGGNANSSDPCGRPAILAAARNGHKDMVRLLGRYAHLGSSLFAGAFLGLIDVVEMQLDVVMEDGSTIDINTTSSESHIDEGFYDEGFFVRWETPLLIAAAQEHAELVRYLLARGATFPEVGWSVSMLPDKIFHLRFPFISLDMLRVLLDGDCDPSDLLGAVLLTAKSAIEQKERDSGVSLPHWRSDAVKLCLEFGAEVTEDCMLSACSVPVSRAEDSSLRLLFELRDLSAVVNCEVDEGRSGLWSPLRVSMELSNFDIAMLLQHGAVLTAALFEQILQEQKKKRRQRKFLVSQWETLRSYVAAGPGGATATAVVATARIAATPTVTAPASA